MRLVRVVAVTIALAGCRQDAPSLVVDISSQLRIPEETNNLVVRVRADGEDRAEQTYALGTPPRDRWPQSLPLLADDTPNALSVAAELRVTQTGRPSVVVGYGEVQASFPSDGVARVALDVPRACVDADDDGFGVGFGCERPDCDDDDPMAPAVYFCGQAPGPDGGVVDAGPVDAGPGRPDAGPPRPDAGQGVPCGNDVCDADEQCFNNQCLKRCMDNRDCGAFNQACLERYGVCICRVPCRNGTDCGPLECLDGCCNI